MTRIVYGPVYWSNANCTGSNLATGNALVDPASTNGSWQPAIGTTTALTNPFNAQSAQLQAIFSCSSGCQTNDAVNWDDAVMDTEPLAVTIHDFTARRKRHGVVLRWRTGSEVDALGFNVFRQRSGGRRVRVGRARFGDRGRRPPAASTAPRAAAPGGRRTNTHVRRRHPGSG